MCARAWEIRCAGGGTAAAPPSPGFPRRPARQQELRSPRETSRGVDRRIRIHSDRYGQRLCWRFPSAMLIQSDPFLWRSAPLWHSASGASRDRREGVPVARRIMTAFVATPLVLYRSASRCGFTWVARERTALLPAKRSSIPELTLALAESRFSRLPAVTAGGRSRYEPGARAAVGPVVRILTD